MDPAVYNIWTDRNESEILVNGRWSVKERNLRQHRERQEYKGARSQRVLQSLHGGSLQKPSTELPSCLFVIRHSIH